MPVSVTPHARIETLADLLPGLLEGHVSSCEGRPTPLAAVVPSTQIADWVQVRLAAMEGICLGLEFFLPQDFVQRVIAAEGNAGSPDPWRLSALVWHILPRLGVLADAFPEATTDPGSRDAFSLALSVADRLDQYAHFRPELIDSWRSGRPTPGFSSTRAEAARSAESWQRRLWLELASECGEGADPSQVLRDDPARSEAAVRLFPRLLVVGTGVLDPSLVRVLAHLGASGSDVRVHIVLPSLHYLGDLRRQPEWESLRVDPDAPAPSGSHPLLESMGGQSVGAFLLLSELDENYSNWPEATASPENEEEEEIRECSLLQAIQHDIRQLRAPGERPWKGGSGTLAADRSLRLHCCHGPRRELEVLRDELLRAFAEIEGLEPHEVLVVAPEPERYAPLVNSVLSGGEPFLPVRLTERGGGAANPLLEGLRDLLSLAQAGRFSASDLISLVQSEGVRPKLEEDGSGSIDAILATIRQSGLTCGLGAPLQHPPELGSWRFARDRLQAAFWFGTETLAQSPEGHYLLPLADPLGGQGGARDRFLAWFSLLIDTLSTWTDRATPAAWSNRLLEAARDLLDPADEAAWEEAQRWASELAECACPVPVDPGVILDWLDRFAAGSGKYRTRMSGAIALGRFNQLRHLPCRVLAILGMDGASFPRQNRTQAWDLLQLSPRRWDRDPRMEDRQAFLDALLAPADRLILLASSRNPRTGRDEPLSACVEELLRVAESTATARSSAEPDATPFPGFVLRHRLQPFDQAYFDCAQSELPPSFSQPFRNMAEKLAPIDRTQRPPAVFLSEEDTTPANPDSPPSGRILAPSDLSLDALEAFWRNPARGWLESLGLRVPWEEEDDRSLDRPPLVLDALQNWIIKHAILENLRRPGVPMEWVEADLRARRALPPGHLGKEVWRTLLASAAKLASTLALLKVEYRPISYSLPPAELGRTSATPCALNGKVAVVLEGGPIGGPHLLDLRAGQHKSHKHLLHAWIQALGAAAAGQAMPTLLIGEKEDSDHPTSILPPIPPEEARSRIRFLISGYLQGQVRPVCFAPTASEEYAEAMERRSRDPGIDPLARASGTWSAAAGAKQPAPESADPAALVVWRELDPFQPQFAPDWQHWAMGISASIRDWAESMETPSS